MTPWQLHVQSWKDCSMCDLCEQRDNIVLARGQVPCDVLIVGEAPGEGEDVTGLPFMGPAGKLLDQITDEAIPRDMRIAWTNLVACYPKEAKDAGTNEPSRHQIEACQPRLEQFIALAKPRLVVAVGKLAEAWIPDSVTCARCSIVHPAAVLRMPVAQKSFAIQKCIVTIRNAVDSINAKTT